ncbi:hypothetical protein Rpal_3341 [Rhodopseudomonas palustris TIE-1]|nr:hypothetical protein Rpal_3341 [Rhodopseudomonas palustris TIE-1]
MSTRRAVAGRLLDGRGIKTSLINFDALYASEGQLSFDSRWTDLLKVHQLGIASMPDIGQGYQADVYFPDLGYSPFIEIRKLVGNVVYDDYMNGSQFGFGATIYSNRFRGGATPPTNIVYAIYRVPVPAP